jgi:hypothetical protein
MCVAHARWAACTARPIGHAVGQPIGQAVDYPIGHALGHPIGNLQSNLQSAICNLQFLVVGAPWK